MKEGCEFSQNIPYICPEFVKKSNMENDFLELEEQIVKMLKTVYDPEIPVNIYDLGLIYGVDVDDEKNALITMTLTAPACPAADFIMEDVKMRIESVPGIKSVEVKIVFEPEWSKDMMSEEAKLELGFL
jgi:FeS assembly SUF system protein